MALTAAAVATKKIKLGTGICLVIERDPIVLAKEVASLDVISNGRVIFGIGGGWNAEEMANHGTPFKQRWKILREKILAMRELWTKETAGVPWRIRQFRSRVELSQAGPGGRTAGVAGIGGEEGLRAGGRLLRRLDADQSARQ